MIVYSATRAEFSQDVFSNQIEKKILDSFRSQLRRGTSKSEITSWKNSMHYMNNVLLSGHIPGDAGVAIEYKVPSTSKRIDFILSGADGDLRETAVIVELKQWSEVSATQKDAIVRTEFRSGVTEVPHPSYQAWTYAALIRDFNVEVQEGGISLHPCAYLHNCSDPDVIKSPFYQEHTDKAPVFIESDAKLLRDFLKQHVKFGDKSRILYRIEHSRLRPSKNLADHLLSLLQGNREFEMIDDQKVVYETALELANHAKETGSKQVLLVEGGPGTGKSVVAINLLVELTRRLLVAHYVTRNAAPRHVYESKLTGTFSKSHITNLFKGSGAYVDTVPDSIDCLIVDEAHRLNEKTGFYQQGENQIKEIIWTAKSSVFFLDQDQRVTLKDIGDRDEIRRWAAQAGADLTELKLESQFRCNGSEGYLSWVNNTLAIEKTANTTLADVDYDFRVFESPNDLWEQIAKLNKASNKARLVAGYCWDWKGRRNPEIRDVVIPEHDFARRWNLDKDGSLWIVTPGSVEEVGCIHTCQGLELDYVGVIFGEDLVIRDGQVVTDALKRSSQDRSVHGYKTLLRRDPDKARCMADRIIKNTYRTLMTRGQKGCYVFSVDKETNEYFKKFVDYAMDDRSDIPNLLKAAEPDPPLYEPG